MFDEMLIQEIYRSLYVEFLQQLSTDDNLLVFFQLHLVLQGISYQFVKNKIEISCLTSSLLNKIKRFIEPGKCYYNAEIVCRLIKGSKYVFGYWDLDSPVEHAWIKLGDKYYDPTYQVVFEKSDTEVKGYYPVAELTLTDLAKLKKTVTRGMQPDLSNYFLSLGIEYKKIMG